MAIAFNEVPDQCEVEIVLEKKEKEYRFRFVYLVYPCILNTLESYYLSAQLQNYATLP